jgi:transcriptional regulator GlxA family with amidase domain
VSAAPRVAIVVFPDVQNLDATGPFEVFHTAGRIADRPYAVELVGTERSVTSSSGLELGVHRRIGGLRGPIDTLIVAGGTGVIAAERDERLIAAIARLAPRSRRVASVCSGAFLLARAGLLDGHRATTHWASCERLRRRHPAVSVEDDAIFVRDGDVWTSAGVTAGMDLALALVEEDLGREVALETARWLVLFMQRPGGQAQFSAALRAQRAEREPLRELQGWIADHLDEDLSVPALARRANMSERTLARAFRNEAGATPAAYVEAARVERAALELQAPGATIDAVARRCGFGTADTMRRAFRRRLGVSPGEWRERFRPALERAA